MRVSFNFPRSAKGFYIVRVAFLMFLVVWSCSGTPLFVSVLDPPVRQATASPSSDVAMLSHSPKGAAKVLRHIDLLRLGEMMVAMSGVVGRRRVSRLTLNMPSSNSLARPVEVLVVMGVLCHVGVLLARPPVDSCAVLDHPYLPLLLMALSMLEPPCCEAPEVQAANPLAGPLAAVDKRTPPNSVTLDAATPNAPLKRAPSDLSELSAQDSPRAAPKHLSGRWLHVTRALVSQADADAERMQRKEKFTGKEVLQESSAPAANVLGVLLQSDCPPLLQQLQKPMALLLRYWWRHEDFLRSRFVVVRREHGADAGVMDEVHPTFAETLTCKRLSAWLRQAPELRDARQPVLADPEPVVTPLAIGDQRHAAPMVALRESGARNLFLVLAPPRTIIPKSARRDESVVLESVVEQWNAMVAEATTAS